MNRKTDGQSKTYFRSSERVLRMNGEWYFTAREGEIGPFASEQQAQKELDRYIAEKQELEHFQVKREDEAKVWKAQEAAGELDEHSWEARPNAPTRRKAASGGDGDFYL